MFTSKAVTASGSKPRGYGPLWQPPIPTVQMRSGGEYIGEATDPAYRNFSAEVDLQRLTLQIVAIAHGRVCRHDRTPFVGSSPRSVAG
jgi:hypothetical protein